MKNLNVVVSLLMFVFFGTLEAYILYFKRDQILPWRIYRNPYGRHSFRHHVCLE